jgi:hypothetical protein
MATPRKALSERKIAPAHSKLDSSRKQAKFVEGILWDLRYDPKIDNYRKALGAARLMAIRMSIHEYGDLELRFAELQDRYDQLMERIRARAVSPRSSNGDYLDS